MKKRTARQAYNDAVLERAEVESLLRDARPDVIESMKRSLAIEFGALRGVLFRLRENLGCEPHPSLVRTEMAKLFPDSLWTRN